MSVISLKEVSKEFKAKQKEAGLWGSIKSIFSPKYKRIKAVDAIFSEEKRKIFISYDFFII